jgi:hypothetical protein
VYVRREQCECTKKIIYSYAAPEHNKNDKAHDLNKKYQDILNTHRHPSPALQDCRYEVRKKVKLQLPVLDEKKS